MEQAHRRAARKSFFIATPKLMRFFIIIVKWVKCVILCLTRLQFQTDVRWVASKDWVRYYGIPMWAPQSKANEDRSLSINQFST